jgi:hypothetical protein
MNTTAVACIIPAIHVEELRNMVGNTLLAANPEIAHISLMVMKYDLHTFIRQCISWDSTSGWGKKIFLFSTASRTVLRPTQPPIQFVPGDLSLRVKQPTCEADHSCPSSAEIKNVGAIPPLPRCLHGMVLN